MRILKLQAENVKKLTAVHIEPDPKAPTVIVSGDNEAGKTSVLDTIWWALQGSKAIPADPVRHGEETASIKLKIGDPDDKARVLNIERTVDVDRKGTLVVKDARGTRQRSPQKLLDEIYGYLTFDPGEWARLAGTAEGRRKQVRILRDLVDFDFEKAESDRKDAYDERTAVNRELASAQGALAELPELADPPEAVDLRELTAKLQDAERVNGENQSRRTQQESRRLALESLHNHVERLRVELQQVEAEIGEVGRVAARATPPSEDIDTAALRTQIGESMSINDACAKHALAEEERRRLRADVKARGKAARVLTLTIEGIDKAKNTALQDTPLPVPGMTFDAEGVKLDGVPFEQASSAQALKASVAMGIALNPTLKVMLIRNGNDLDKNNRKLIAAMAEEAGAQLWIEMVESDDPAAVVIVDGAIATKETP